ncbi:MAG: cadherin domain-containing protein, partial [Planctomycetota bacterium]|nr:cadherin domain-containing protein [Planctomycetota bacterium]
DTSFTTKTFTISIGDVDEFDVSAPIDSDATTNAVDENAANGTAVGVTGFATDDDATTNAVTYSLFDDASGRFEIDGSTGVVTVADGSLLDRETAASHNITIRATSADGSMNDSTFTIAVNDLDEFDVTTPVDTDATTNAVDENAANGTAVGITGFSTDDDATTNGVTYSLFDDAGGPFAINSATGVVTVADGSLLDREAAASHDITIRATSADGSTADSTFTVSVNDLDEFDVTAPVDTDATLDAVDENAANGTAVGVTGFATDDDATTNGVTYSLFDDAGGRFAINSSTGVVTVADGTQLDRESNASHNITIRATSADGSTADSVFVIAINDLNEFDVSAPIDTDGTANAVDENAANGTTVGITGFATDDDATTNGVTYSLFDDAGGRFAINSATGVVTVADGTQLDRESNASHNITIRATSADGSTNDSTFTISLNDVDEFDVTAPADVDGTADAVDENAANGTPVGVTGSASDADATTNGITYSLFDDAGGRFTIDASTGIVTVADGTLLDREAAASHDITVRATSDDTSTGDTIFTVSLNDVDEFDVTPISDVDADPESVAENLPIGSAVGIEAFADDFDGTDTVSYSLDDTAGGRFRIDSMSGVVTTDAVLDAETATAHSITVRATSTDGSTTARDFTISIVDVDEFDTTRVTDVDATADGVDENVTIGTAVGITALAQDNDVTDSVLYSLDSDAGRLLAIDPLTGVVTVADDIDFEVTPSLDITIRATSTDGSFSTLDVTIPVGDLNDNLPVVTPGQVFSFSEFATNLTVVGTALATDVDTVGTIQNWSITGGNGGGVFSIDPATGTLRVADNSTVNFEVIAGYTLTLIVEDGSNVSVSQTVTVNVIDENDLPVLTTNEVSTVVEGSSVVITSAFLEVFDEDDLPAEIIYIVSTPPSVGRLELTTGPGAAIGSFTQDDIDNGRLIYVHDGSESDDLFTFTVSDGSGGTISATDHSIIASRVNDAPVNSVPGTQSTDEDTPLVLSAANGNRISISDDDVFGDSLGVRLTSTNGTLTLSGTTGLTFALGTGADDVQIVFAGSAVDINAALDGLRFEPDENYHGPATVRVEVRDFGSSGSGGERTDGDTVNIVVRSVNDAPVSLDDAYTVRQFATLRVAAADGLSANDQDVEADNLRAVVVDGPEHGTLVLNPDGSLTYVSDSLFFGRDTFTYLVTDGSASSEVAEVVITVQQTVSGGIDGGSGGTDGGGPDGGRDGDGGGDGSGDGTDGSATDGTGPDATGVDPVTGNPDDSDNDADDDEVVGVDPSTLTTTATDTTDGNEVSDDDSMRVAELASSARRIRDRQDSEKTADDMMSAAPLRTWNSEIPELPEDSIVQVLAQAGLWNELDQFEREVAGTEAEENDLTDLVVGTTSVAGTSLTVGYVIWLLRSGSILVSFVSSLPAWTMMDPLPVLEDALAASGGDDDDDSLQSLFHDFSDES